MGCTSLCVQSGALVLLKEGGHLPLVRTLGWPQPMAEEGEATPNVLQTPGSETWHPTAHDDYQDTRAGCSSSSSWGICSGKDMDQLLLAGIYS